MNAPASQHLHAPALDLPNAANGRYGARVVACSDEFFADAANLVKPEEATFDADRFTERGKWMDGWESRRTRSDDPTDWAIIELAWRSSVELVDVDTSWFVGNAPREVCLDIIDAPGEQPDADDPRWQRAVDWTRVAGGVHNLLAAPGMPTATHVRLVIAPDGGVARLRVHGRGRPAGTLSGTIDAAACVNGALVVDASDWFFSPAHQLTAPGSSQRMDQGWETRRRRDPGDDWVAIQLAAPVRIAHIEVDTTHYHGNAPAECALETLASAEPFPAGAAQWRHIGGPWSLDPDSTANFPVSNDDVHSCIRLIIRPCGGIARLRILGEVAVT